MLFESDENYWIEHLRDARQTLETYRESLKALLQRQATEIE